MTLTDAVKARAKELGADLVGIAPVERFAGAPHRMSPQGLLPGARSVVVAAIHHLDAAVELGGEPTPHDVGPYGTQSSAMNPWLDDISFWLARFLERHGHRTLPIAASNIWRYKGYKDLRVDFAPDLAHRYAAVAAGLAEIGWSGLALTPQFGPRQRFVSIITEAELDPSPMYDGEPLCDRCMECVKQCPTDAFRKEVKKINDLHIGGRSFQFPDTNKWRCAWAENFGLSLHHAIPDEINEGVILEYLERYGPRSGEEGCCLKFCMAPQKRYYDPAYCRAPRRKKTPRADDAAGLLEGVRAIADRREVDAMATAPLEAFANDHAFHPRLHLPDVASVISLALEAPPGSAEGSEMWTALRRLVNYTAFEIAHSLDLSGYSAITGGSTPDLLVAQRLGTYRPDACVATVLTSAALPSVNYQRPRRPPQLAPEQLRDYCRRAGADLVGFFAVERFDEFRRVFNGSSSAPQMREVVNDAGRALYGAYVPRIDRESVEMRGPQQWLLGARSVVVLGLHFPDAALDTAKTTPAETTGPFAFAQYETLLLLADIAAKVARRLSDSGYRATFTSDLTGLASKIMTSRGLLPDMRANLFAAMLAGLAYPGVHGYPLTREYGTRQRFIAIVTDAPLASDPLYHGAAACEACARPCVEACPTRAIATQQMSVEIEGRRFALAQIDAFACDWAKRYGLSGKEGTAYWGLEVEVPLPDERNAQALAAAVSAVPWGVQKRHLNMAEECLRVCPARGERLA
jgi:epoxyqueuosine reductase QueG